MAAPRLIRMQGFNAFPAATASASAGPKSWDQTAFWSSLDHVSVLSGKHAFKFGGEFIYNESTNNETANAKGQIRFKSLDNFFLEGTQHKVPCSLVTLYGIYTTTAMPRSFRMTGASSHASL